MNGITMVSLFETCEGCGREQDPSKYVELNLNDNGLCSECQIEVKVNGLTYPVGNPSTARGKYARVAWEEITEGDTYKVIGRPIDWYITADNCVTVAVGETLTVTSKKRDYGRTDQCRYTINMTSDSIDGIEIGWTLLALNTDVITRQLQRTEPTPVCNECETRVSTPNDAHLCADCIHDRDQYRDQWQPERECTDCQQSFKVDLSNEHQRTKWQKCTPCAWA